MPMWSAGRLAVGQNRLLELNLSMNFNCGLVIIRGKHVALGVVKGLVYMHKHHVIHGNLKVSQACHQI